MSSGPLSITQLLGDSSDVDQIRELMREVIDPELGVNIVSLGLVYGIELNGRTVAILVTMTTPACPLADYITSEIERVLLGSGCVDKVETEVTYEPPWSPDMMDAPTKEAFGWS